MYAEHTDDFKLRIGPLCFIDSIYLFISWWVTVEFGRSIATVVCGPMAYFGCHKVCKGCFWRCD